jgi:hypothetical protein
VDALKMTLRHCGGRASATAVAGIPARVVSEQGSAGYVNRTGYPPIRD